MYVIYILDLIVFHLNHVIIKSVVVWRLGLQGILELNQTVVVLDVLVL